ncbi:hypothetical protein PROFUN_03831 [Planoprotostelium fungivorum]|uniref:MYND-type domain-containing protein n=1 Tax=Planoprotostelium fungivorum TaxID=1890364 RepID=A0A2P6NI85_9EUKA|nr:hypothetical protein PROFUN_03831 [Planoprotostelium fungivorum]
MNPICAQCQTTGTSLLRCSRCRLVHYCSAEHQRAHWTQHKKECKLFEPKGDPRTLETKEIDKKNRIKKAPQSDRFPPGWRNFVYKPSPDGVDENLLILFHGMGDSEVPYAKFAQQLNLPQTATLALRAPLSVPLMEDSYCWIPSYDENFERLINSPLRLKGIEECRDRLDDIMRHLEELGWYAPSIFMLGFSQGGAVVMHYTIHCGKTFGGSIIISGNVLDEYLQRENERPTLVASSIRTPFFITHGRRDQMLPISKAREKYQTVKDKMEGVEWHYHEYDKGHTMISSKEEAKDLVEFFSKRLKLRNIALEDRDDLIQIN